MRHEDVRAMRLVFVSSLKRYGGGERWMLDTAARLQSRGHGVRLVSRPGSVLGQRSLDVRLDNVPIEMRGDFDPLAIHRLSSLIRRFRPHVICVNLDREVRIAAVAIAISRLAVRRRPRLVPRRGSEFPLKDKLLYRILYRHAVDRVIVNSQATAKTMVSRTPWFQRDKLALIYNGIDVSDYEALFERRDEHRSSLREALKINATTRVVTLVGELNERKGQRHIVSAARRIVERVPDAHFLFVGDGDARAELEAMIEEKGLGGVFSIVGFRKNIPEILVGSDLLVLPSRVEGFGYVLVEAMAAGLPVVASNASSIPEIVVDGETGILHPVGDGPAIAAAITRVLENEDEAQRMGERGRQRVRERFLMDRMIDEVESLFHALCGDEIDKKQA